MPGCRGAGARAAGGKRRYDAAGRRAARSVPGVLEAPIPREIFLAPAVTPQAVGSATKIHPTAIVHPTAELAEGVEIGPGAVVGEHCRIGAGTRLLARAVVVSHTVMGQGNEVHPGAVVGGDPQDRKFTPSNPGRLYVGDQNVFREGCTINRSVGSDRPTRIGNRCFFMTNSHIGHNSIVGDGVTLANGACVAGHAQIGDGCFLSACSAVHQFCVVGELVMFQFGAGISQHAPSFVLLANGINRVIGLNRVGLLRSPKFTTEDRVDLKTAYKLLYRGRDERMLGEALREAQARSWGRCASSFLDFVRDAISWDPPRRRGICGPYRRERRQAEPSERMLDVD